MGRRVLVVVNPVSGRRRALRAVPRFLDALRKAGGRAEEFRTAAAGDATRAAAGARGGGFDAVVAVGGDGTVNEILNGLDGSGIPVAILPTGTANVLARDLRIPFDPEGAARTAALGAVRTLDTGSAAAAGPGGGRRRLLCCAGAGLDGAVVAAVARARGGRLGFRGWLGPLWRTLRDYPFPPLRVTVDGVPAAPCTVAVILNAGHYGGIFDLVPGTRPDDGAFDLCLLDARRRRSFFRYLWAARRGTLARHGDAATARGTVVRVEADVPVPVQVDGDPFGTTPLEVTLVPASAQVLVPATEVP
jgi:diacylglycerol kinase (ATP)